MQSTVRIGGFLAGLLVAFGAAFAAGSAVAPEPAAAAPPPPVAGPPLGLTASAGDWAVTPLTPAFTAGSPGELALRLDGPAAPAGVHVAVLRDDTAGYQELTPTSGGDGVWRAPLTLPAAGTHRAYVTVDTAAGATFTLGTSLVADGPPAGATTFGPSRVAQVGGYQVRLDGELQPGRPAQVFATIGLDGEAVTDLEPHDAGFGRLVAVRQDDLAFVAATSDAPTPAPGARSGPGVAFTAEVPGPGVYRVFLQFRHAGAVHAVEFTVPTPGL